LSVYSLPILPWDLSICFIPFSNSYDLSVNEKFAYTILLVASSIKAINIAFLFLPFTSVTGTLKACISSACTHSNGEKNSNLRFFSLLTALIRFFLSSPEEIIILDNDEDDISDLILPSSLSFFKAAVAVTPG